MLIAKLKNKIHISLRLSEKFPQNEQKRLKNRRFFIFQVHFFVFSSTLFSLFYLNNHTYHILTLTDLH